jgi:hypothetical protein
MASPLASLRSPALLAAVFLFVGCADQGEGERCDLRNGNTDCESGLTCTSAEDLNKFAGSEQSGAALCCPPSGEVTVEACFPRSFDGLGDSGAPEGDSGAAGGAGGEGGGAGNAGTAGSAGAAGASGGSGGGTDGGAGSGGGVTDSGVADSSTDGG